MKRLSVLVILALFAVPVAAQCGLPVPGFATNVSLAGSELNLLTPENSTANAAGDNEASTSTNTLVSMQIANPLGAGGGLPLALLFSAGAPVTPSFVPRVYINVLSFLAVADGIGLTGSVNPFVAHPGPGALFALTTAMPNLPAGSCFTFQGVIVDPAAASGINLTNACSLGVTGGVASIQGNNFGAYGATVTAGISGSGTGALVFKAADPARLGTPPLPVAAPGVPAVATVPPGADSGNLRYADGAFVSSFNNDSLDGFFAVTDSVTQAGPGALIFTPSSHVPASGMSECFATAIGSLATAATTDTWTIPVTEGDYITVEVFSLNQSLNRVLNGTGNAGGSVGFDPGVNINHQTNVAPLTFDILTAGPGIPVTGDDDSGPGQNARVTLQARGTDTLSILVGTFFPGSFVTGDYLLNVRKVTGAPVITGYSIAAAQANIAQPNETVTILGANFQAGQVYDVTLIPVHGLYAPVTIPTNVSLANGSLDFTTPSFALGTFGVGAHYVQVTDVSVSLNATSAIWDTSFFGQPRGMIPDILIMRSVALTPYTGNPTLVPNTSTAAYTSPTAAFVGGYSFVAATAPQTIYVEAFGTDPNSNNRLADSYAPESIGAGSTVYNPILHLYAQGGIPLIAQNDNDGNVPTGFNWPVQEAIGIGLNSAVMAPAGNGTATHWIFIDERVCVGACTFPRGGIVNVVVL